ASCALAGATSNAARMTSGSIVFMAASLSAPGLRPANASRRPVGHFRRPHLRGAMSAAIDIVTLFDAMADDSAAAMGAFRCQHLNRAFETVEDVSLSRHADFETLVIVVATLCAAGHGCGSSCRVAFVSANPRRGNWFLRRGNDFFLRLTRNFPGRSRLVRREQSRNRSRKTEISKNRS